MTTKYAVGCSIGQTFCRGDNYNGKNFVPQIKTRSPVVKAVKLMAWRQAKSPKRLPPELMGKGHLHKFPNK